MATIASRTPISKKARFEVFKRDGFACSYCGSVPPAAVLEIDHIRPISAGGGNEIDNLTTACFDCNRGKGARLLTESAPSLESKADLARERHEQLLAYRRLLKRARRLEDRQVDEVQGAFELYFAGRAFEDSFRESVRHFLQRIPVDEVISAMHMACSRMTTAEKACKYFCGICWAKIKEAGGG